MCSAQTEAGHLLVTDAVVDFKARGGSNDVTWFESQHECDHWDYNIYTHVISCNISHNPVSVADQKATEDFFYISDIWPHVRPTEGLWNDSF